MRIAIFASGGGSNFQAIADACRTGEIQASVVLCVASSASSGVCHRARSLDIPVYVVESIDDLETEELAAILARHQVDLIALAGFMKKIPASLVRAFKNRMLNIHPALLPAFGGKGMYGVHVHEAVIAQGVPSSGATVHIVDEEYDTGPIVLQESIAVLDSDTPATLALRVLEVEHRLYPRAIDLFARKMIQINGREVIIQPIS